MRFANASSERAEKQTFWNDFFAIFEVDFRQVAVFERLAKRSSTASHGWIDLLYPGNLGVEHKSEGEDLDEAMQQLLDYLPSLLKPERPWLLVACDFQTFKWDDLRSGRKGVFALGDLADHVELFWWLAGHPEPNQADEPEEAVNFRATEKMRVIHDELKENGYPEHELREWLTRILFCMFADYTGIWDNRGAFHTWVASMTRVDGSDLGSQLVHLFQILNTRPERLPKKLDEQLAQFTYINGDLFSETLSVAPCTAAARAALLEACRFNWSAISPAIFGSMFQNVMKANERRQLGAHYTTESNILKVIRPLFLDDLEERMKQADSKPKLRAYLNRLTRLTFLDPACGCGNFLVIAYREVRRLETAALRELRAREKRSTQQVINISIECRVRVDQFYGIEVEEFPAKIARTALYLMDHLCNREVSKEFGQNFARFPIPAAPHVVVGNALRMRWSDVLPAERAWYVFGNPPFLGQKNRTAEQTEDLRRVWGQLFGRWLDYVSAWFFMATMYLKEGIAIRAARPMTKLAAGDKTAKNQDIVVQEDARCALVSTNSITQGEQVARIWEPLLAEGVEIEFAHRTFKWTSEATGTAVVHCVIIGFCIGASTRQKQLWEYADPSGEPIEKKVARINPYLLPRGNVLVRTLREPLGKGIQPASYGNKPADGSFLVIKKARDLPTDDPIAMTYVREYIGTDELVGDKKRWCLWITADDLAAASKSLFVRERVAGVRKKREESTAPDTQRSADTPYKFFRTPQPTTNYLGIPRHVTEARLWFTVAHLDAAVIASDSMFTALDPDGLLFGLLSSRMYIVWLRNIGGAIKSDLRFSQLVHTTFPFPGGTVKQLAAIRTAGAGVAKARAAHPSAALSQLYDPDFMPPGLLAAHAKLDRAVESAFAPRRRLTGDLDRLEVLFDHYVERMRGAQSDLFADVDPEEEDGE